MNVTQGTECVHFDDPFVGLFPGKKQYGKYMDWENLWGKIYTNKKKRSSQTFAIYFKPDGTQYSKLSYSDFQLQKDKMIHVYPVIGINTYLKQPRNHINSIYEKHNDFIRTSAKNTFGRRIQETFENIDKLRKLPVNTMMKLDKDVLDVINDQETFENIDKLRKLPVNTMMKLDKDVLDVINEYKNGSIKDIGVVLERIRVILEYHKHH